MPTDTKRREVARRLRGAKYGWRSWERALYDALGVDTETAGLDMLDSLADLIAPSYKPNAEYEAWYDGLSHFGDERRGPSTIRELIEEIVWAALTVDLGPNGNTDPSTGIDEGGVYTDKLFAEWEREALRLSGGIDRDALLALAEDVDGAAENSGGFEPLAGMLHDIAHRIREALGVES